MPGGCIDRQLQRTARFDHLQRGDARRQGGASRGLCVNVHAITDDFAQVEIDHVGNDPAGAFERLTAAVLTAWEATDDLETPRVTPMGPMPPAGILLFGAQDIFVHAWDVAVTIGATPELSGEMIEVFTRTHRESIDETMRAMFFADAVPVPDDASPLDQLVAFLGRRPSVAAPASTTRVVAG